ncbi:ROK family protein [Mesobacillus foraminis]|uniref:ROK family protein n=1 Tax=Mesobacillus foraminis TaxID=279826 RepID=UPI000EF5372C|nr:ROK family protein [Mesobacillus foraminis]
MYLVIDIGGTFAKYSLMDSAGNITEKNKKVAPRTNYSDFKQMLFSIIEEQDLPTIRGIAISCPGTIDTETGVVYYGGSFPFLHEVNLTKLIEEKYGIEVSIENDGKCAALAELWLGSVKGAKDAVVMVLGTGVGGGIILGGKIHRGINLSAGELSYVMNSIDPVTREASFFGFDGSAVEMIRKIAVKKQLEDSTDGLGAFEFVNQNDREAMKVFDEYCINIATQILNLQYILDPEVFAIGGGISAQLLLLERIKWAIEEVKKANPMHMATPNVVPCRFRNDANLYGALYHFFMSKDKLVFSK